MFFPQRFGFGDEILTVGHDSSPYQLVFNHLSGTLPGIGSLELPVDEIGLESTVFLNEVLVAPPFESGSLIAICHPLELPTLNTPPNMTSGDPGTHGGGR